MVVRMEPLKLFECVLIGEKNPDEGVRRAIAILSNLPVNPPASQEERDGALDTLEQFITSRSFPILRALIEIVGIENLDRLREKLINVDARN